MTAAKRARVSLVKGLALGRQTVFQLKATNWTARTGLGRFRKEGAHKFG